MTSSGSALTSMRALLARALVNALALVIMLAAAAMVLPGVLGLERYVITGDSMSGTFERGSLVLEKVVPVGRLRVGDVITYQPPADSGLTNLVTHRIHSMRRTPDGVVLRTKGDVNPDPDPWLFSLDSATQPRVQVAVPQVGYVFIFVGDRSNRMLLVGVPAALVALASLRELIRALRRPRPALSGA